MNDLARPVMGTIFLVYEGCGLGEALTSSTSILMVKRNGTKE